MSNSLKEILVREIIDFYKDFFHKHIPSKIFTMDKKFLNVNNKTQRIVLKKHLVLTNWHLLVFIFNPNKKQGVSY